MNSSNNVFLFDFIRNQFNPSGFANSNQSPQWPVPNANLEGDAGNFNMMIDNSTAQMPVVTSVVTAPNYHQKTSDRMRDDESKLNIFFNVNLLPIVHLKNFLTELEDMATISAVLYCNQNHPEMKQEFPNWTDRCKQILKKWRALSSDKKQPYLQRARENRSTVRTKKAQQVILSPRISSFWFLFCAISRYLHKIIKPPLIQNSLIFISIFCICFAF